ncbi:ABC transporter permease subunit, partial [Staphylococcus aureus]|nr:ABC transporter permease subunit [Staphylococcus aureus]
NHSIKDVKDKHLINKYMDIASEQMVDDGSFIQKYGTFFLKGLQNTIIISLIGVVCGAIIGSFIALAKLSKFKIISLPATIYIEFLRGTPMLVQVFIVFFGTTALLGLDISALICGTIALVINSSA